jgi:hypothetical protein
MTEEICWFCKKAASFPAAVHKVPMYGSVHTQTLGYEKKTTWNTTVIHIPRCSSCKAVHGRNRWSGYWQIAAVFGFCLSLFFIPAFGVIAALTQGNAVFVVIAAVISLLLLLPSAMLFRASNRKALRDRAKREALGIEGQAFEEQYPQVMALLTENWKIGVNNTNAYRPTSV